MADPRTSLPACGLRHAHGPPTGSGRGYRHVAPGRPRTGCGRAAPARCPDRAHGPAYRGGSPAAASSYGRAYRRENPIADHDHGPAYQGGSPAGVSSYGRAYQQENPIADHDHGQAYQAGSPAAGSSYGQAYQRPNPDADHGHGRDHGHGSRSGRQDAGHGHVRRHPGYRHDPPRSSLRDRRGRLDAGHHGLEPNCPHHAARSDPAPGRGHARRLPYPSAGTSPPTGSWPGHAKRPPTRSAGRRGTHQRTKACSCCGTGRRPRASCCHSGHRHRRRHPQVSSLSVPRH
jgi:hypothetical protein